MKNKIYLTAKEMVEIYNYLGLMEENVGYDTKELKRLDHLKQKIQAMHHIKTTKTK